MDYNYGETYMLQKKKLGQLGACSGIPTVRASKVFNKILKNGYTLIKPNGVDTIPVGSAICVPIHYYAGIYFHWGIVVSPGKIADYSGTPITIGVRDFDDFSYGVPDNIRIGLKPRSVKHANAVVQRILSRVGENNYNIFSSNCETLVMWSYFGADYSHQVSNWLSYLTKRLKW